MKAFPRQLKNRDILNFERRTATRLASERLQENIFNCTPVMT
jgi:hypothetical protein